LVARSILLVSITGNTVDWPLMACVIENRMVRIPTIKK